jgi:very-short-patch-repair endonuclease
MNELKWQYYELKRLWRLWVDPEPSARRLIKAAGPFWLWRRGARREYKVKLWKTGQGWYAIDLVIPRLKKGVEADGWSHRGRQQRDVVRDHRLGELGWQILRIDDEETKRDPRAVRRRVRKFLKR